MILPSQVLSELSGEKSNIAKLISKCHNKVIYRNPWPGELSGKPQRDVAESVGATWNAISRLWIRFQEIRNVGCLPGQGLPHATTVTEDRYLMLPARRDKTHNVTQLQRMFLSAQWC